VTHITRRPDWVRYCFLSKRNVEFAFNLSRYRRIKKENTMYSGRLLLLILCGLTTACSDVPAARNPAPVDGVDAQITDWLAGSNEQLPNSRIPAHSPEIAPPVSDLIAGLEARLESNPDDVKGWRLLAQSYSFTGDSEAARNALNKAVSLGADRSELNQSVSQANTSRNR